MPIGLDPVKQEIMYPGDDLHCPSSVRLLKIHEALYKTARIVCTLRSFDLADRPRFRALSYTWGLELGGLGLQNGVLSSDADQDQEILCNDQPFLITQNLQDALVELRQSGFTDWLWVDAICIDQSSSEERASQVSRIGQIYASAVETVAWLGKDESGVDDIQWGIEVMIPKMLQWRPALSRSRLLTDPELGNLFGVEDLNGKLRGIKYFLATNRWFHRARSVQEVALASTVCIRVGERQFSWTDLTNLSTVLAMVSWENVLVPRVPELEQKYSDAKSFLENLHGLRDLIPRKAAGRASKPAPALRQIYRFLEATYGTKTDMEAAAAWIAHLLSLVRNLESSEEHDKIYSILGVANVFSSKTGELVSPDYGQSVEELYTSVTAALLLNGRYLSILAHVGDISNNQLTNIPSWVVDYSRASTTNPILDTGKGQATHFDASLASDMPPVPRKLEGTRLTLIGAKFDKLNIVSPATLGEVIEDVCHFEDFMKFLAHLPDRYLDGRSRMEVVWRAMMMDSEETATSINHPPPSSFAKAFQSWVITTIDLWVAYLIKTGVEADIANESARQVFACFYPDTVIDVPEEIQEDDGAFTSYHRKRMLPFILSIKAKVYGRKLFKTKGELLGLGSRSIQADDQVWLIRDSKTPLILRPKSDTQDFLLVGEAYLHGFMHGEMLDDRWELEKSIGPVTIV
jgi:Heterokaryon incompatibility protein (HET)